MSVRYFFALFGMKGYCSFRAGYNMIDKPTFLFSTNSPFLCTKTASAGSRMTRGGCSVMSGYEGSDLFIAIDDDTV